MILASHQPDFLPYMGYFYKMSMCDTFVFSDDVLYSKKGMHNWNTIKTPGGPQKLTIPVHAHHDLNLCEITVSDIRRSLTGAAKTIEQNYRRAPHYDEGLCIIEAMSRYAEKDRLLMRDFNIALTVSIMERFGIRPRILVASADLHLGGQKDKRILRMCDETGADVYLSGRGAADYHRPHEFELHGVELRYTDYQPVEYPQLYGPFVKNLSVIDYVFNCGFTLPDWRRENG